MWGVAVEGGWSRRARRGARTQSSPHLVAARTRGHVQHRPVLRGVDLGAAEHGADLALEAGVSGQGHEQLRGARSGGWVGKEGGSEVQLPRETKNSCRRPLLHTSPPAPTA
jgi:hypothetical protein